MSLTKPPPPPPIAASDPTLNRWFLAVTAFLKNDGTIDPASINGYPVLQANVAALDASVAVLEGQVAPLPGQITALQGRATALEARATALEARATALEARAQVLNGTIDPVVGLGSNGDWYANTSGGVGHRIFVKVAGAWVAFPF